MGIQKDFTSRGLLTSCRMDWGSLSHTSLPFISSEDTWFFCWENVTLVSNVSMSLKGTWGHSRVLEGLNWRALSSVGSLCRAPFLSSSFSPVLTVWSPVLPPVWRIPLWTGSREGCFQRTSQRTALLSSCLHTTWQTRGLFNHRKQTQVEGFILCLPLKGSN